jgi:hypothetical protein
MAAALAAFHVDRAMLLRGFVAGGAWGIGTAAGFTGLTLWRCGVVCLDDVAFGTLLCVATGLLTIGPLAAFRGRAPA